MRKFFFTIIFLLFLTFSSAYSIAIEWVKCSDEFNTNFYDDEIYELLLTPDNIIIIRKFPSTIYSTNNGKNWFALFDKNNEYSRLNSFQCTEDNMIFASNDQNLYKSEDNGKTWRLFLIADGLINQYLITSRRKIVILSKNNSLITIYDLDTRKIINSISLLECRYLIKSKDNVYVVTRYSCYVFKNNFSQLTLLSNFRQRGHKLVIIDTVFIFNPQTTADLRISYDYGATWSELKINDINLKYNINGNMAVDSKNNLYVFVAKEGLFKSSNIGKSWKKCLDINDDCKMIYINPKDEILIQPKNSNFLRSDDGGESWFEIELPKQNKIYYNLIDFTSNSKDVIYLIRGNNTTYISTNRGSEWIYYGTYTKTNAIALSDNGDIYHLYENGIMEIRYSGTNGWMLSNQGLNHFVKSIFIENQEGLLLIGTVNGGIYRSTNNGLLWKKTTSDTLIFTVEHFQRDINGDYYAISMEMGLLKSTNKGAKWLSTIKSDFYSDSILDFKINSNGIFYALKKTGVLYFSSDKGFNWQKLELPMSYLKVNSFAFTKANDIFIGTDYYGVLRYNINTQQWISESSGLKSMFTTFIRIDSSGHLYCSVLNNGLYRSRMPVDIVNSVENPTLSDFNISISPNPAREYIEISLGKEALPLQEIRIYNTLGECVLVEQASLPVQRLDVSSLPPGIYSVRLGENVKKFVKI